MASLQSGRCAIKYFSFRRKQRNGSEKNSRTPIQSNELSLHRIFRGERSREAGRDRLWDRLEQVPDHRRLKGRRYALAAAVGISLAAGDGDLPLPKPVNRAMLAAKPRVSGECRFKECRLVDNGKSTSFINMSPIRLTCDPTPASGDPFG